MKMKGDMEDFIVVVARPGKILGSGIINDMIVRHKIKDVPTGVASCL